VTRFAATGAIGEMDAIYSMWTSDVASGFAEHHIVTLQRLITPLAAALKCVSLARIAATLVETYLGDRVTKNANSICKVRHLHRSAAQGANLRRILGKYRVDDRGCGATHRDLCTDERSGGGADDELGPREIDSVLAQSGEQS
jgi:hypothetical protein